MADFRKISVLVAMAVLLGLASTASAQTPFSCTATAAVPPTLRSEGVTELVGDIVLTCTGGVTTQTGLANFTVFLNTNVTSRTTSSTLPALSEALLMIDEPAAGNQFLCTTTSCTTTVGAVPSATNPNVFQGTVSAANQVQFIGIPVNPPGTSGARVFRITNIRANASGISPGAGNLPGQILALTSITGSTSIPVNNPSQIVGFASSGLTFNVRKGTDFTANPAKTDIQFPQCTDLSRTTTTNSFVVQFRENFPTSFKLRGTYPAGVITTIGSTTVTPGMPVAGTQNSPGSIYNTESGFQLPTVVGAGTIGTADSGTRLKAVFNNIPAGVSIFVSNSMFAGTIGSSSANLGLAGSLILGEAGVSGAASATFTNFKCTSGACGSGAGVAAGAPFVSGSVSGFQLPVVNGSATAVWEVTGVDPLASNDYNAVVWFSYTAAVSTNSPAAGTTTVSGGFAPTQSGIGATATAFPQASSSLNIPRFVEPTTTQNIFQVFTCRTNLLFPFVTNQFGFDTGLAIANTSADPFASGAQAGTCQLFFYGANAPATFTTPSVAAGTVWANTAFTISPNFQGYVIAQCAFQFGHGFAFVSDQGARNLAMGYLALVIPDPGLGSRAASPDALASGGTGENLGQ